MNGKYGLASSLEDLMLMLREHQVEELRFSKSCYELRIHMSVVEPCRPTRGKGRIKAERAGFQGEASGDGLLRPTAGKRLLLLRSPAVGTWSPVSGGLCRTGGGEEPVCVGKVKTLMGDEELPAPYPGRAGIRLAADGAAVGFGTPVAFWEVD